MDTFMVPEDITIIKILKRGAGTFLFFDQKMFVDSLYQESVVEI